MRIGDFHIYAKTVLSHSMLTHVYVDVRITFLFLQLTLVLLPPNYSETITFKLLSKASSDAIFEIKKHGFQRPRICSLI